MIKNILVTEYTNSGFTQDDAEKIVTVLKAELPNLSDGDVLSFDFSNVKFFTTLFFNIAFYAFNFPIAVENSFIFV